MNAIACKNEKELSKTLFEVFQTELSLLQSKKGYINIGIATGNTFIPLLHYLNDCGNIPYEKINLFMVDEYVGFDITDERSCAIDLVRELSCLNRFHKFCTFDKSTYLTQLHKYNLLLKNDPFDILLLGIGIDGHFAFCYEKEDPLATDIYKFVNFSEKDRQRQVEYGWFDELHDVPQIGISLTTFGALSCKKLILAAQYSVKRKIINDILTQRISVEFPIYPLLNKRDCLLIYG